jgi:hypothetical protein
MLDATPLLRAYAAFRLRQLRRQDPLAVQERTLLRLVARSAATRFGRDHDFGAIRSVADYQTRVPLRRYEDFWRDYWQAAFPLLADVSWPGTIPYFALTSGTTTGTTKYIPVSRSMIRSNVRAGADVFVHHVARRPDSRVFGGLNVMLGGSTALLDLAPGVRSGDLSGVAAEAMPLWARLRYFPPRRLETIADWETRIGAMAPEARRADVRSIGGVPSWLLLFFDRLAADSPATGGRLESLWPGLELVIHGGVNFAPYRQLFRDRLAGGRAETREVYPASEGFMAIADRGDGEGLRLVLDRGLFFEFVPIEDLTGDRPTRHWLANVEHDVNYAVVLSTCAGLWSYVVGDTVRFVDLRPPRVLVTGRTTYSLSAFGEHLIAEEVERAVAAAAGVIGLGVVDFAVGAVFPGDGGTRGGHLYIVEFGAALPPDGPAVAAFAGSLDAVLADLNEDYRAHRAGDFGMLPPRVHAVALGTFAAWMKQRGRMGGQHKVPRIVNDDTLFRDLRLFAGSAL